VCTTVQYYIPSTVLYLTCFCVTGGGVQWPPQWSSTLNNTWGAKERVLDRYASHTQHCATCLRAVARFQLVRKLAAVAAAAAAAASVLFLPWPGYAVGCAWPWLLGASPRY